MTLLTFYYHYLSIVFLLLVSMVCVILMTDNGNLVINRWAHGNGYKGQSISESRVGSAFVLFYLFTSAFLFVKVHDESNYEYYANGKYQEDTVLGIVIVLLFLAAIILMGACSQRNFNFKFNIYLQDRNLGIPAFYERLYKDVSYEELVSFNNKLENIRAELLALKHYLEAEWPFVKKIHIPDVGAIFCTYDEINKKHCCSLNEIVIYLDEEKCKPDIYSKSISLDIIYVTDSRSFLYSECWIGSHKMDLLNVKNQLSVYLEREGANFYWLAKTGHNKPGYSS